MVLNWNFLSGGCLDYLSRFEVVGGASLAEIGRSILGVGALVVDIYGLRSRSAY